MRKHKYLLLLRHKHGFHADEYVTFESVETNVNAIICDAEAQNVFGWHWEIYAITNVGTGESVC